MKIVIDLDKYQLEHCKRHVEERYSNLIEEAVVKGDLLDDVLDEIRTEILQLDYDVEDIDYDYNDMAQTEEVHMICREEVLQIIDKYKEGESE